jgi:hypothetical protein
MSPGETIAPADAAGLPAPVGRPRPVSSLQRLGASLAAAYLAIITFPLAFEANAPGLDPSWTNAINRLPHSAFRWGSDVTFTWGPLGYLVHPQAVGNNLFRASLFWFVVQVAFATVVVALVRSAASPWAVGVVVAGLAGATALGLQPDIHLLLLVGLALCVDPERRTSWRYAVGFAAALSAALLLIKFSVGIGAALMLAAAATGWILWRWVGVREAILLPATAYVVTLGVLALAFVGSLGGFFRWLGTSLDISRGYSAAMSSFLDPPPPLALAGVAAGVFVGLLVVGIRMAPRMAFAGLVLLPFLAMVFKQGFVKHGGYQFFPVTVALLSIMALGAADRRALVAAALAVGIALGITLSQPPWCRCEFDGGTLVGVRGAARIASALRPGLATDELATQDRENLTEDRLPESWLDEMELGASVGVVPWELNLIPANRLTWSPNPTLQTYVAFTSDLDRLTARHYRGDRSPTHVLVQFAEVDGRHPMQGAPAAFRTILRGYRPSGLPPSPPRAGLPVLLLERRPTPLTDPLEEAGSAPAEANRWLEVPQTDGLVFGRIDLQPTFVGRLARLAWQIPPLYLDARLQDGPTITVRLVPDTAGNGLLLGPLPLDLAQFEALLGGEPSSLPRVSRIRVRGPGAEMFEEPFEVTWETLAYP